MNTLDDIRPGLVLGRYEFLLPIAKGGMAAVWAARVKGARGFQKTVAIKTILPGHSDNTEFERMFLDESRVASRIRHPHVAEIIDLGEQDDVLYLVMEWVDGEPLVTLIRALAKTGMSMPLPIAVKLIADAAQGLHSAHQLKDDEGALVGLVHRDVSPQNILLSYEGIVKVVDFGIAKAAGRLAAETATGQLKGKVPYMSPEQVSCSTVDRRTDIFALGTLLYQLTTGKHPFRGATDIATLSNIIGREMAPPRRVASVEYPPALEAVVLRALERDPDKRFQTAAELARALDEVFTRGNVRATSEELATFVTGLVGEQGEKRRQRLKTAIREADARLLGTPESETAAVDLAPMSLHTEHHKATPTLTSGLSDEAVARIVDEKTADTSTGTVAPGSEIASARVARARVGPVAIAATTAGIIVVAGATWAVLRSVSAGSPTSAATAGAAGAATAPVASWAPLASAPGAAGVPVISPGPAPTSAGALARTAPTTKAKVAVAPATARTARATTAVAPATTPVAPATTRKSSVDVPDF